jgi:hypothetical protein
LELFPITQADAGILWYPIERAPEVLHIWTELTRSDPPDELTTIGRLLNLPSIPEIPEPVRGKSFVVVEAIHVGDPATADERLAPLRALGPVSDTIQMTPAAALLDLHLEPGQPVPAVGDGVTLVELPPAAIDALVEAAGGDAALPLLSVEVRHLEGELNRDRAANGALSSIAAKYLMYAVSMAPSLESQRAVGAQVTTVKQAMAPWAGQHMFLNFADTRRSPDTLWTAPALKRLRAVKARIDPDNLLRANHTILPAD